MGQEGANAMIRTGFLVAFSFALAVPLGGPAEESRTVRVGSDAELARALAGVKPGDTLLLADGTYAEPLRVKVSGAAGRPITIRAEHPRKAVFSRKGQSAHIEGSFLRIEGLVFDSQYGDCTCVRVSMSTSSTAKSAGWGPRTARVEATASSSSTRQTAWSRSASSITAWPRGAASGWTRTASASPAAAT